MSDSDRPRDDGPSPAQAPLSYPSGREEALRAEPRPDGSARLAVVLGATGYIGGRLVPRLLAGGYRVRVLVRDGRLGAFSWGDDVEVVEGSADDARIASEVVADADVVYYLIHSMRAGKGFEDADILAARTIADAAASAHVGRIVYLGGLHPEGVKLSEHLQSRVDVGDVFLHSGVPTVALQAGVVIGSGSASFEMIRHLTDVLPYMPAPKWVRNHIQPIAVRDVLHYLLGAARVPADVNCAVDIGGPDVLRYGQMMNGYAVEAGLPQRPIAAIPVLAPWLAAHWVGVVTPVPKAIARPLIGSLQNECVMKDHDVDGLIPQPEGGLTPYRTAVHFALGREKDDDIETSWVDSEVSGSPSDPLPSDPDWTGRKVYVDERTRATSASAADLWTVIQGIGGQNGWYSASFLWQVRGLMDRFVGGVGLARGRRSRGRVTIGDAIDFWRVEAVEPGRLLRLRAEMKVPGEAWLELEAVPEGEGSEYHQRAVFFPKGLSGRLYWMAVLPFHGFIFPGMARRITAAAEAVPDATGSAPERAAAEAERLEADAPLEPVAQDSTR